MEKRLVLFLFLSSAVFLGWSYLSNWLYPQPQKTAQKPPPAVATPVAPSPALTPPPVQQTTENKIETTPVQQAEPWNAKLRTDHWVATISNKGGVISDF